MDVATLAELLRETASTTSTLREVRLSFGCFKPTRSFRLGLKAVQQGAKGPSGLTTLPNDE